VCPPSNARLVAEAIGTPQSDVKVVMHPNSAHLVAADVDREAVADEIASFVEGLAARA
jgi:hypothetical protein